MEGNGVVEMMVGMPGEVIEEAPRKALWVIYVERGEVGQAGVVHAASREDALQMYVDLMKVEGDVLMSAVALVDDFAPAAYTVDVETRRKVRSA